MNRFIHTISFCFLLSYAASAQIILSVDNPSCGGGNDGSISVSVGVGGNFVYKRNGGSFQPDNTFNNLGAGGYTITVKDLETNCEYSKDTTLTGVGKPSLSVTGGGNFSYCANVGGPPKVELKATASGGTPPYTYNWWSSTCGQGCIVVSSTGEYKATVEDANGCKDDATVYVEIIPIECIIGVDPNDITGPTGYGDPRWVSKQDSLGYRVRFENDPTVATGPARKITIDVPLEEDVALNSFRIGSFGFANLLFDVPPNRTFYQTRVDAIDSLGVLVDVLISVDIINKKAFWIFQAIDPATGLPSALPTLGMLPVNDTLTHEGEGFVDFIVKPAPATVTGDVEEAQASIVFDQNAAIETNVWVNTIDAVAPTSNVDPLPAQSPVPDIEISWEGTDDTGGSGVKDYALYVSEDGDYFTEYQSGIVDTSITFIGQPGSTYSFYTRARDNAGNVEPPKATGTVPIYILPSSGAQLNLSVRVYLMGAFDQATGMMKDDLRQLSLLPVQQPYTTLGFQHAANPQEQINGNILTTSDNNAIVDWVLVQLLDKDDPQQLVASRAGLLQRDGDVVDMDGISSVAFESVVEDLYYLIVRHRNHLGVMTATPVSLSASGTAIDFTDDSTPTFGTDAQADVGGVKLLWPGDANGDGQVIYAGSGTDVNAISSKVFTNSLNTTFSPSFPFQGYDQADLNMDGQVIYAGAGTDVNLISLPIFTFPANLTNLSPTFVIMEQLP